MTRESQTTDPLPLEDAARLLFEIAMTVRKADRQWQRISQTERDKWVTVIALGREAKKMEDAANGR